MTVAELDRMPAAEYVEWRAFYVYEQAMIEFEQRRAKSRG